MTNVLGKVGADFLETRGISLETAVRFGLYTAHSIKDESGKRAVVSSPKGQIIVFPFVYRGDVVAEKYRTPDKRFWQREGGKRTFWNVDVLDDPSLSEGLAPLIVVEGEIDCLTAIDCGFPFAVSVPDGAPSVRDGEDPTDLPPADPVADKTGKFEFIWNNRDQLKKIKRFIIAVDKDKPGQRLEAELLRRLSPARCSYVTYPDGCKDLNDILMKHGQAAVTKCINGARPYPVHGLYALSDYPDNPDPETFSTGFPGLDDYIKLWLGELVVVTGIPGHGKTSMVINLCVNLADKYGWPTAMASFEVPTVPMLRHKLRLVRGRAPSTQWTRPFVTELDEWIGRHFFFIDSDPAGELEQEMNLEWLLEKAAEAVMKYGIKVLVIDPWNEIEHARPRGETETDYANRALRLIKRFARHHEVVAIILAHPTKDVGKDGVVRAPSLYEIAGSAAFYNKPDHGIVIHSPTSKPGVAEIYIKKVRFGWSGKKGKIDLAYDAVTETYSELSTAGADRVAF